MPVELSAVAGRPIAGRLGVLIRVAAFWCAYAAIILGVGRLIPLVPPAGRMLATGLFVTVAALALTRVMTSSEGASLATVGAEWSAGSVARFSAGLVFGGAMIALLLLLSRLALGPFTFARSPDVGALAVPTMVVTFLALAAGEELGFRGYPFHRLRERYGIVAAQAVVALAFAGYHVLQGWPLVNALVGTTVGSVLFGTAVIATRGLAFPIGVHAAWNVGSWLLGTKGEAGVWRMDLARQPSFGALLAVYLGVMVASMLALWWWMSRREGTPAAR